MTEAMSYLICAVTVGTGATLVMDLWTIARKRLLGIPALDYGLVGRWLIYMLRGRFRHDRIVASPPVRGEQVTGWIAHYLIGIGFAFVLLTIWGVDWARHPRIGPALVVGLVSVAAPFLIMQPAMGAGIAASRTPRPAAARFNSLLTHTIFGLGLYAAARVATVLTAW